MPIRVLDEFQADNEIVQIVQDETGARWAQARPATYPGPIAWRELDDTEVLIERVIQLRDTIGGMHASIPYELPAPPQEPAPGGPVTLEEVQALKRRLGLGGTSSAPMEGDSPPPLSGRPSRPW